MMTVPGSKLRGCIRHRGQLASARRFSSARQETVERPRRLVRRSCILLDADQAEQGKAHQSMACDSSKPFATNI